MKPVKNAHETPLVWTTFVKVDVLAATRFEDIPVPENQEWARTVGRTDSLAQGTVFCCFCSTNSETGDGK